MTSRVDELVDLARAQLPRRVRPDELADALATGALVVDIRPGELRRRDGDLPGAVVVDRNQLEWRLDPTCDHRIPESTDVDRVVVLVCDEGYASSLAAQGLHRLGLTRATDLEGGFQAWLRHAASVAAEVRSTP